MPIIPNPYDSTYFDSPYFNPEEAANVAADPTAPGLFDYSDLAIEPAVLANATVGFPYVGNITLTGGYAPYTSLSVINGMANIVAANLVFDVDIANFANANITGISNLDQTVTFTIQGSDDIGNITYATSTTYNLQVVRPNIVVSPSTLTNAVVGTYYTQTFTSTNGSGTITYSNVGNLPSGMSLVSATGNMSGTVNSNVTPINFTIVATDSYSSTGNTVYSWNIEQPVIDIDPPSVPDGVVGVAYDQTLSAYGGIAPYTYSVTGGVLPANVALNFNTGNLTGTPTTDGLTNFTVTAFDSYQSPGSRTYSPTIALPTITLDPTTLSNAITGQYYLKNITANGGTPPYTYAVTSNAPPANLSFTSTGILSGIVNQPGTTIFEVTATDSYSSTGNIQYTLVTEPIDLVVGPSTIPTGSCGTPYFVQFYTSGGITPYTFYVSAGSLPPGLSLNPLNGVLSGICLNDGNYAFSITVTDAYLNTGSNSYTTSFVANILPNGLPNPTVDKTYTQILSAVGGVAPYTYSLNEGTLPAGLTLINNLITGVPTDDGPYSFVIKAVDADATDILKSYAVTVLPKPPIAIAPPAGILPKAKLGVPYTVLFEALGGNPPYTYAITSGTLPTGLTLNTSTGVVSGTPTVGGSFNFRLTATDSADFSVSQLYVIPVLEYPVVPDNAIRVYVGGTLQTSGYTITSTAPATVVFDDPPPANVSVSIAVLQGYTWYAQGLLTASNGIPLQEQTTPDAIFLQGK